MDEQSGQAPAGTDGEAGDPSRDCPVRERCRKRERMGCQDCAARARAGSSPPAPSDDTLALS